MGPNHQQLIEESFTAVLMSYGKDLFNGDAIQATLTWALSHGIQRKYTLALLFCWH